MDRERLRRKLPWFAFAAGCLAADLWSKHLVFYPHVLPGRGYREGMIVDHAVFGLPWWRTILAYNQGVTFGSFTKSPAWVLAILTGAVIAWMAWKLWTLGEGRRLQSLSISMIVGGAIGNLYDRTLRPAIEPDQHPGVRDFLDWYVPDHWPLAQWCKEHFGTAHWFTSNVADVLIVCGVILLAWCLLREPDESTTPPAGAPQA